MARIKLRALNSLLLHQIIGGLGQCGKVIIALGMVGQSDEDILPARPRDDGGVVAPIFPGARFAKDLKAAFGESFYNFGGVVGAVRRGEDVARCWDSRPRDEV